MSSTPSKKGPNKGSAAAARAVAAARAQQRGRRKNLLVVVVVLVVAAAVLGGLYHEKQQASAAAEAVVPAVTVAGSAAYPAALDPATATVLVGKPAAPVTLDVYEDFLCPICGKFEAANFAAVNKQLAAGTIKVSYHMLDLLDSRSVPAGYSTLAANTALAVAAAAPEKFVDFHASLFGKQPEENGPGWTQQQLTNLAGRLGVSGPAYDAVISGNTYGAVIQANLAAAEADPRLQQQGGFGTPTVVSGGALIDWQQPDWLTTLVRAG